MGLLTDDKKKKRGRSQPVPSRTSRSYLRATTGNSAAVKRDRAEEAAKWEQPFDETDWVGGSAGEVAGEVLARGIAKVAGRDKYDTVKTIIDYGFQEVDADGIEAIARWAINPNSSYEEMPPGALRYELPAGMLPGIGDLQALRDVWRDIKNKQLSGWTAVDLISAFPAAGVLFGMLRSMDNAGDMGKMWRHIDDLRKANVGFTEDEIFDLVRGQKGMDEASARRVMNMPEDPSPAVAKTAADAPVGDQIGTMRATGRGADALQRAYGPELRPTALDEQIAREMNAEGFGGGTWTAEGTEPPKRERYLVSPSKETETILGGEVSPMDIAAFRSAHADELKQGGYVGAWVSDGNRYLDVSRGFTKKQDALHVAANGDQMAIADRRAIAAGDWDNAFPANPFYDEATGGSKFPSEIERMDARAGALDAIPHWGEASDAAMLQHMDPQARAWYEGASPRSQAKVKDVFRKSLAPEDMAAMIALGEQTMGWYDGAAKALQQAFVDDAYQFTALLAATSPNVPVPANTRFALDMWDEWVRAGRPNDPDAINELFDMVREGLGTSGIGAGDDLKHMVTPGAINNIQTVLTHPEPFKYFSNPEVWRNGKVLSGLKVDPFFSNVVGDLTRYTNDTHMLKYGPTQRNSLARRAGMSAATGAGAAKLADDLGLPADAIQMANAQEMAWEPIRQLYEMSGRGSVDLEDLMFMPDGSLNMDMVDNLRERMGAAEDFAQLLQTPEAGEMIARAGGNPNINVPKRPGLGPMAGDAAGYAESNPEAIRRAIQRMKLWGEGKSAFSVGGLAAGAAARQGGLLGGPKEEESEPLRRFNGGLLGLP